MEKFQILLSRQEQYMEKIQILLRVQNNTGFRVAGIDLRQKTDREKERLNDGNNNGQLRIATQPRVAHSKPPGPK